MAADQILRADDTTGTGVKTYVDGSDRHAQAVVLEDASNAPIDGSNPLPIQVYDGDGAVSGANPLAVILRDGAGAETGVVANPVAVAVVSGSDETVIERWGVNLDVDSATGPETVGTRFGQAGGPSPNQFPWPTAGLASPDNYEITGGTAGARLTIRTVLSNYTIVQQVVECTGGTVTVDILGGALLGTPIQAWVSNGTALAAEAQIRKPSGGVIYHVIETAIQQTESVTEVVPADSVGYVRKMSCITTTDGFIQIVAREPGGVSRVRFRARVDANRQRSFSLGDEAIPRSGLGPLPAGTWVEIRFQSLANNGQITARLVMLIDATA